MIDSAFLLLVYNNMGACAPILANLSPIFDQLMGKVNWHPFIGSLISVPPNIYRSGSKIDGDSPLHKCLGQIGSNSLCKALNRILSEVPRGFMNFILEAGIMSFL